MNPFLLPYEVGNLAGGLLSAELPSFNNSFRNSSTGLK
jgi:hypothetical protein